jgi:acetylornithine deacetylase/succinyl-diaminopimelate desuccinylase-like protein
LDHTPNERIRLDDYEQAIAILDQAITALARLPVPANPVTP